MMLMRSSARRLSSAATSLVRTERCGAADGLLRVCMAAPPVNSLGLNLITELTATFKRAAEDPACEGIVLASEARAFSAGLNLRELHGASREDLDVFWTNFQELCFTIYGAPQMVVAEINGAAPAAGTIISMCCDARVATAGSVLGLNESAFGLVAPFFAVDMARSLMGSRAAYRAIGVGTLFRGEAAAAAGLVDVVSRRRWEDSGAVNPDFKEVNEPVPVPPGDVAAAARADAEAECEMWLASPGRAGAKRRFREDMLHRWIRGREQDKERFVVSLLNPITQQRLGDYLASLSKK